MHVAASIFILLFFAVCFAVIGVVVRVDGFFIRVVGLGFGYGMLVVIRVIGGRFARTVRFNF